MIYLFVLGDSLTSSRFTMRTEEQLNVMNHCRSEAEGEVMA